MERWAKNSEVPLMAASVAFLLAYAAPIVEPGLPGTVLTACRVVVWVTWALFAVDYLARLVVATDRWAFVRGHLLELAARWGTATPTR